jgi:hypothetical protein
MCFSAMASFAAAGLIGLLGLMSLRRVKLRRELPLALMPIIFAIQQGIEGMLWLSLEADPEGVAARVLALGFLLLAEVVWPLYVPAMALLIEHRPQRQLLVLPWLAVGAAVASYMTWTVLGGPHGARIVDGHIVYVTGDRYVLFVALPYLAAITVPLLLSAERSLVTLGSIVMLGYLVTFATYWMAFVSVWYFFAAAASATIVFHFYRLTSAGPRIPGA